MERRPQLVGRSRESTCYWLLERASRFRPVPIHFEVEFESTNPPLENACESRGANGEKMINLVSTYSAAAAAVVRRLAFRAIRRLWADVARVVIVIVALLGTRAVRRVARVTSQSRSRRRSREKLWTLSAAGVRPPVGDFKK